MATNDFLHYHEAQHLLRARRPLDDDERILRQELLETSEGVAARLQAFQEQHPDVDLFQTLLWVMVADGEGRCQAISHSVLMGFCRFLCSTAHHQAKPTLQTKKMAFAKFVKGPKELFVLVSDAYDLQADRMCFVPYIRDLLTQNRVGVVLACWLIAHFQLHSHFSHQESAVPLILSSDSNGILENFLQGSREHQEAMVKWLDSLVLFNMQKVDELCEQHSHLGIHLMTNRLQGKALTRLIRQLISKFQLLPQLAPQTFLQVRIDAFYFLINSRFNPKFTPDNWRDLVKKQAQGDRAMQDLLLDHLCRTGDMDEAAFWLHQFGWSMDEAPEELKTYNPSVAAEDCSVTPTEPDSSCFYQMDLPMDQVYVIDQEAQLPDVANTLANQDILGLDCESAFDCWKMSVNILQVATRSAVFILDLDSLLPSCSHTSLGALISSIFQSKALLVGYELNNDLCALAKTSHLFADLKAKVLDLDAFMKELEQCRVFRLPFLSSKSGLSGAVERLFGYLLDKKYQLSDWSVRPMKPEQLKYAALDALILVRMHDTLLNMARRNRNEATFHAIVSTLTVGS